MSREISDLLFSALNILWEKPPELWNRCLLSFTHTNIKSSKHMLMSSTFSSVAASHFFSGGSETRWKVKKEHPHSVWHTSKHWKQFFKYVNHQLGLDVHQHMFVAFQSWEKTVSLKSQPSVKERASFFALCWGIFQLIQEARFFTLLINKVIK